MPDELLDDQLDTNEQPSDAGKGADKGDSITLSRKDYESLQGRMAELETSERFWAGKAAEATKPEAKDQPKEEEFNFDEEDLTPDQIVDLLASKGKDGLKQAGFVSRKELQKYLEANERRMEQRLSLRVSAERERYNADAALIQEFPELSNNQEFVQAVAKELEDVPVEVRKSHAAIRLAAKAVKASMGASSNRRERIAAQAGDTGRIQFDDDDSDTLSPLQRKLLESFNREGKPISEERFANRMRSGVRMSVRSAFTPGSKGGYEEPKTTKKERDPMEVDW